MSEDQVVWTKELAQGLRRPKTREVSLEVTGRSRQTAKQRSTRIEEIAMNTGKETQGLRSLSFGSIALGVLGIVFFWWVPLGMVASLAGLTLGFIDWESARRRSLDYRLSVIGLLVGAAALTLDIVIAVLGMQTITFGS
jgi:hypothetical protein